MTDLDFCGKFVGVTCPKNRYARVVSCMPMPMPQFMLEKSLHQRLLDQLINLHQLSSSAKTIYYIPNGKLYPLCDSPTLLATQSVFTYLVYVSYHLQPRKCLHGATIFWNHDCNESPAHDPLYTWISYDIVSCDFWKVMPCWTNPCFLDLDERTFAVHHCFFGMQKIICSRFF